MMLVATLKGSGTPAPVFQPQPGNVALGDQTRIIVDHADSAMQIYYILDIQNTAPAPVQPAVGQSCWTCRPGAESPTVLAGAPKAVARGDRVTVSGPFAPGQTPVEVAYRLQVRLRERDVRAKDAAGGAKPGRVDEEGRRHVARRHHSCQTCRSANSKGSATSWRRAPRFQPAGHCRLTISGLPHHSAVPRRIALAIGIPDSGVRRSGRRQEGRRRRPTPPV